MTWAECYGRSGLSMPGKGVGVVRSTVDPRLAVPSPMSLATIALNT
jgi:hypothetical protein